MKVLVVGSIGKRGEGRIDFVYNELKNREIDVHKVRTNYGNIDWGNHVDEAQLYQKNSERYFRDHKFDLIVADLSGPSDGRTHQLVIANSLRIPIFGYSKAAIDTPWRLVMIDRFFRDINELVAAIKALENMTAD